jgi:hypothetical protein
LDCGSLLPLSRSQPAGPAPFKHPSQQAPSPLSPSSAFSELAPHPTSPLLLFHYFTISNFPHRPLLTRPTPSCAPTAQPIPAWGNRPRFPPTNHPEACRDAPSPPPNKPSPSYGNRNLGLRKPAAAFPESARWPGTAQAPSDQAPLRTSRSPNTPGIARLRTRATQPAIVLSDQAPLRTSRSPNTPGIARLRTRATQHALAPSDQAPLPTSPISNLKSPPRAAGSGLLGESQLSGRTRCARPALPASLSPLLTSHFLRIRHIPASVLL